MELQVSRSSRSARWLSSPDPGADRSRGLAGRGIGPKSRSPRHPARVGSGRPRRPRHPPRPMRLCLPASPKQSAGAPRRLQRCGASSGGGRLAHASPRKTDNSVSTETNTEERPLQPKALAYAAPQDPGPATHLEPNYTGSFGAFMCPPRRKGWGLQSALRARARGLRTALTFPVMAGRMGGDSGLSGTQGPGDLLCSQIGVGSPCSCSGSEPSIAPGFRLR